MNNTVIMANPQDHLPNNSPMVNNNTAIYATSTLRESLPVMGRTMGDGGLTSDGGDRDMGPTNPRVVDRLSLTLGDLLLEGTFGRVYQGRLDGCGDVMVKTVVMGSS